MSPERQRGETKGKRWRGEERRGGGVLLTPVIKDSNKHLRTIAPAGYNYKWTRIKAVLARNIVLQRTSIFQYILQRRCGGGETFKKQFTLSTSPFLPLHANAKKGKCIPPSRLRNYTHAHVHTYTYTHIHVHVHAWKDQNVRE